MNTTNCALLTPDVILDAGRLLESPSIVTPGELHALNSLIEAAVFHERLYVYQVPAAGLGGVFEDSLEWDVIHPTEVAKECEEELKVRGLEDTAN